MTKIGGRTDWFLDQAETFYSLIACATEGKVLSVECSPHGMTDRAPCIDLGGRARSGVEQNNTELCKLP